jgi:tetratricopeptide (TPR) repeat protein
MQALLHLLPEAERRKLLSGESYSVHPVVREYLLGRGTEDERRKLHLWAAAFHGQPFVEMARRFATQSDQSWTDEQIEALARARDGVVGQMVARTDDLAQARVAMDRALEWQHHLFAAGAYEAAESIVNAVYDILARWGERDRAKALLRGSIETQEGPNKAVAQGNLASLLSKEGKLDEALEMYEAGLDFYRQIGAHQQLAARLSNMSQIHAMRGDLGAAIALQDESLSIEREIGNEEGQAVSLHQLAILYRFQGDYATALARNQEAEKLFRKLNIEAHIAATLHEQGLILTNLARAAQTDEEGTAHLRAAAERFEQSLDINRRIGNEADAASTLSELGKLWMDAGQMREAIRAFTEALEIAQRLGDPVSMGIRLEFLGGVHERQGHYAAALEKYQQALNILERVGAVREAEINRRHIGRVQAKLRGE